MEAATNPWTSAEDKLKLALPQLTAWQKLTKTDAADDPAAEAAKFVFVDQTAKPESGEQFTIDELRERGQYGLIYSATQNPFRLVPAGALGDSLEASGTLILFFERLLTEHDLEGEATPDLAEEACDRWLKNRIGELFMELYAYWPAHGGPRVQLLDVVDGPFHTHPKERENVGHWQGIETMIRWGLGRG